MMIKYRVNEVAKDLGEANNKGVIDLLQKYTGETKKAMTALTDQELNIVFEHYTQKNSVKSFDEYFKTGEASRRAREEEKAKLKAKKLAEQEKIAEMLRAAKAQATAEKQAPAPEKEASAEREAPVAEKAAQKKAEQKTEEKPAAKQPPKKAEKPQPAKQPKKAEKAPEVKPDPNAEKEFERAYEKARKKEKAHAESVQPNRGPGTVRHVDTRTAQVELDKYNEKYTNLAPERSDRDTSGRKQ